MAEARDAAAEFNDKSAEMETNMEKLGNLTMRNQGEHARQAAEDGTGVWDAALRMGQTFSAMPTTGAVSTLVIPAQ